MNYTFTRAVFLWTSKHKKCIHCYLSRNKSRWGFEQLVESTWHFCKLSNIFLSDGWINWTVKQEMTFIFHEAWTEAAVLVCNIIRSITFVYFQFIHSKTQSYQSIPKFFNCYIVQVFFCYMDWVETTIGGKSVTIAYFRVPFFLEAFDHFSFECRKKWSFVCYSSCPSILKTIWF